MSWIKLNSLLYLGISKKQHLIFRAKSWNKRLEKIFKKEVFNQNYDKIGIVKDIFGPVKNPFISIKPTLDSSFNPDDTLYVKAG